MYWVKKQKKVKIQKTKNNEYLLSYNFVLVSRNEEIVIEATGLETTSSKKLIPKFVDKFVDLEKRFLSTMEKKLLPFLLINLEQKLVLKTQKFVIFK